MGVVTRILISRVTWPSREQEQTCAAFLISGLVCSPGPLAIAHRQTGFWQGKEEQITAGIPAGLQVVGRCLRITAVQAAEAADPRRTEARFCFASSSALSTTKVANFQGLAAGGKPIVRGKTLASRALNRKRQVLGFVSCVLVLLF